MRALSSDIAKILRHGLPIRSDVAIKALLRLPGIQHRASNPDERGSRLKAVEGLLRWQLAQLGSVELRPAATLLFGIGNDATGTTLMRRRTMAAAVSGYEVNHFRKRIEPRLVSTLAWQLRKLSDEYTQTFATPPRLSKAKQKPPTPPSDVFAWETIEHQELICRLWSSIYGLRAALLRVQRMISMQRSATEVRESIVTSLWQVATLTHLDNEYRNSYAGTALGDSSRPGPTELISLAGWTPPASAAEAAALCNLAVSGEGASEFAKRVSTSSETSRILRRWEREFGASEGTEQ